MVQSHLSIHRLTAGGPKHQQLDPLIDLPVDPLIDLSACLILSNTAVVDHLKGNASNPGTASDSSIAGNQVCECMNAQFT